MERAAAGTEVLVSRHGKPYTRLCPAQPLAMATRSSDPERS